MISISGTTFVLFGEWLLHVTAGWFIGQRQDSYDMEYDGRQPGMYR